MELAHQAHVTVLPSFPALAATSGNRLGLVPVAEGSRCGHIRIGVAQVLGEEAGKRSALVAPETIRGVCSTPSHFQW